MSVMQDSSVHDGVKRCTGRPPACIDRVRLQELAGLQLSVGQIAACLGISRRTLFSKLKTDLSLRVAYQAGISEGIFQAANTIMDAVKKGDVKTAKYFLRVHPNH